MDRFEPAIADFQQALAIDPEFEDAWFNLKNVEEEIFADYLHSPAKQHLDRALAFALDEENEKALAECELARQTLPGIAYAHNTLGMILQQLGLLEDAIGTYLEAVRLNPRYLPARENLGNARKRMKPNSFISLVGKRRGSPGRRRGRNQLFS